MEKNCRDTPLPAVEEVGQGLLSLTMQHREIIKIYVHTKPNEVKKYAGEFFTDLSSFRIQVGYIWEVLGIKDLPLPIRKDLVQKALELQVSGQLVGGQISGELQTAVAERRAKGMMPSELVVYSSESSPETSLAVIVFKSA